MSPASARALLASLPERATAGQWYVDSTGRGVEMMSPEIGAVEIVAWAARGDVKLIAAAPALRDALGEALRREAELLALAENARSVAEGMALSSSTHDAEAVAFACIAGILTIGGRDV